MTDNLTSVKRSENMRRITSKNTFPEMIVRKLVHKLGYRYRLHRKDLPGKPDIVFTRHKKLIFVHGCFWHQHKDSTCKIARIPKSNRDYWGPKLERNIERDKKNLNQLEYLGWSVLIIWECQTENAEKLEELLILFLSYT